MQFKKALFLGGISTAMILTGCKKDDDSSSSDDVNSGNSSCGITITSSNAPSTADAFIITDANDNGLDIDSLIGIDGDGKTWDFSALTSAGDRDSILLQNANQGSDFSNQSAADYVIINDKDTTELYFKTATAGFDIVGAKFDFDGEMSITNPLSLIPYALEQGKTITDEFVIEAQIDTTIDTTILGQTFNNVPVSIDIKQTNSNVFNVTGCGTVITPKGQFECLLYIVEPGDAIFTGNLTGTINNTPLNIPIGNAEIEEYGAGEEFNVFENKTYVWISKDSKYPLLQIEVNSTGQVENVKYQE